MIPLLIAAQAGAQDVQIGLREACDRAIAAHPDATVADLDVALARIAARRARLDRFQLSVDLTAGVGADWRDPPDVGPTATHGVDHDLRATLAVPLFSGFANDAAIEAADARKAASEASRRATHLELCRAVTMSYWQISGIDLRLAAARESLDLTREAHGVIRGRADAGLAAPIDVNRSAVGLIGEETSLTTLEDERFGAVVDLARWLDEPATTMIVPTDPIPDDSTLPTASQLLERARSSRPDLQAAKADVEAARAGERQATSAWWPHLTLDATAGTGASALGGTSDVGLGPVDLGGITGDDLRPTHDAGIGLTLHANPFNLFKTADQVTSARLSTEQAEARLQRLERTVEADLVAGAHSLRRRAAERDALGRELELARDNLAIVRELYALGSATILDLFDAQQSFRSANTRAAAASVDLALFAADLAFQAGVPPHDLEPP